MTGDISGVKGQGERVLGAAGRMGGISGMTDSSAPWPRPYIVMLHD